MPEKTRLGDLLDARFADAPDVSGLNLSQSARARCEGLAGHAVCRAFTARPVPEEMIRTVAALALSTPSKSDLQQRDIIWVEPVDALVIKALLSDQQWIADAPEILIFCGNNRRQRQMHAQWGRPFANDHLDAFFNASVDAGIALSGAVMAAQALGMGCCPISTIRNHAAEVGEILGLPDHVFPVAALALGWPAHASPRISQRLPLGATFHKGHYADDDFADVLSRYDAARPAKGPDDPQRAPDRFGIAPRYVWSDDKTRQYALPERTGFGRYVRGIGFDLT